MNYIFHAIHSFYISTMRHLIDTQRKVMNTNSTIVGLSVCLYISTEQIT